MSVTRHINETPGFRFIDDEELIDYIFTGFEEPLSFEEKLDLIREHGRPRTSPKEKIIEGKGYVITLDSPASAYETQMIHRLPS